MLRLLVPLHSAFRRNFVFPPVWSSQTTHTRPTIRLRICVAHVTLMATKAFDYALTEIDLVGKAVNALQGLVSNTAARQRAIRDLQILEAVLRGAEGVSIASASEETLRNLHYCSQFCRPPLNRFLRSLKELEPDFCHASARGESLFETNREPVWATRLESEVALLQRSVGTGLRAIDLLLRVEAMRCDMAANTTLPGDLQRIIEALQEHLHGPGKRHVGPGHHYNNIQNSGGYSHYGDKYFFNGAPPVALIEAMAKKLDGTAGMLQIGQVLSIEEDPGDMLPRGDALARVVNDNTPGPFANEQPLAPQTTQLSAMELTKLLLQCLLELSRTKLNALLAMLLWTIPDFRAFVRSLTVITRLPSMLLHDNITLVDALNREVSLPYQWFREWPHMLAHLQYEFKGTPGELFVSESRFDLFQDSTSSRSHSSSRILSDQWEESVSPGIRVVMSMRLDAVKFKSRVCPSCKRLWMTARVTNEWTKW